MIAISGCLTATINLGHFMKDFFSFLWLWLKIDLRHNRQTAAIVLTVGDGTVQLTVAAGYNADRRGGAGPTALRLNTKRHRVYDPGCFYRGVNVSITD